MYLKTLKASVSIFRGKPGVYIVLFILLVTLSFLSYGMLAHPLLSGFFRVTKNNTTAQRSGFTDFFFCRLIPSIAIPISLGALLSVSAASAILLVPVLAVLPAAAVSAHVLSTHPGSIRGILRRTRSIYVANYRQLLNATLICAAVVIVGILAFGVGVLFTGPIALIFLFSTIEKASELTNANISHNQANAAASSHGDADPPAHQTFYEDTLVVAAKKLLPYVFLGGSGVIVFFWLQPLIQIGYESTITSYSGPELLAYAGTQHLAWFLSAAIPLSVISFYFRNEAGFTSRTASIICLLSALAIRSGASMPEPTNGSAVLASATQHFRDLATMVIALSILALYPAIYSKRFNRLSTRVWELMERVSLRVSTVVISSVLATALIVTIVKITPTSEQPSIRDQVRQNHREKTATWRGAEVTHEEYCCRLIGNPWNGEECLFQNEVQAARYHECAD